MIDWFFYAALACAIGIGAWLYRRYAADSTIDRSLLAFLPLALLVAGGLVFRQWIRSPFWERNAALLTPIISLKYGYRLYYPPGTGPVLPMVYGPVMAAAYYLTSLFHTPTGAVVTGCILATLYYFLPAACAFRQSQNRWLAGCAFAAFCFLTYHSDSLRYSAFRTAADAPALALAAAACLLLTSKPGQYRFWLSTFCAVLAVWTKQIMLFMFPALLLYVDLTEGHRCALRYAGYALVNLGVVSILLGCICNPRSMFFYMWEMPSHRPWIAAAPEAFLLSYVRLVEEVLWFIVPGVAIAMQLPRSWKGNPWILWFGVGVFMIPATLWTRSRIGGDVNSFSYTGFFFLIGSFLVWLQASERSDSQRLLSSISKSFLFLIMVIGLFTDLPPLLYYGYTETLMTLPNNPQQVAYNYARTHPGETYFPWDPLPTLLAEGKLYHFEYGLLERQIDRFPVPQPHFQAYIPAGLKQVAFYSQNEFDHQLTHYYLPDYTRPVSIPELPGWNVVTRS